MSLTSRFTIVLCCWCCCFESGAAACLPNAIPTASRLNVSVGEGLASMPLTLCQVTWDSGSLLGHAARILLQEKIGYNVQFAPQVGTSSRTWMQVADCNSTNPADKCFQGPPGSVSHLAFEIWESYSVGIPEKLAAEVPGRAPIVVGELGALGTEAFFVDRATINNASQKATFLQWYESYNTSWSSSHLYFDNHADLPKPDIRCNEVYSMQGANLVDYEKFTGDSEAIIVDGAGSKERICDANGWALSPACRRLIQQGATGCIPAVSTAGWGFHDLAQKSVYYDMPVALGSYAWDNYTATAKAYSTLTYWWTPDSTLLNSDPVEVVFPRYDPDEYALGIYRSAMAGTSLLKLSNTAIANEVLVQQFVKQMEISIQSLMKFTGLSVGRPKSEHEEIACNWLKDNEIIWNKWIPDPTKCIPKQGLVDSLGSFLSEASASNASMCKFCAAGRHSDDIQTPKGPNFVCKKCEGGRYQSNLGETSCAPCASGMYSSMGAMACDRCAIGQYQTTTGQVNCTTCAGMLTTQYPSSEKETDCECAEGSYRDAERRNVCHTCPEGMSCAFGSDAANFAENGTIPQLLPSYFSEPSDPLFVYLCLGKDTCPGGQPGSCGNGRVKLVCASCPDAKVLVDGTCKECEVSHQFPVFVLAVGCAIMLVTVYHVSNDAVTVDASNTLTLSVTVGMLVTVFQLLGSFNQLALPWPTDVKGVLDISTLMVFNPDSVTAECVFGSDATARYVIRVIVPYLVVITVWMFYAISKAPCLRWGQWEFNKTINTLGQILQTLFIAFAAIASAAFQCYSHPNGEKSNVSYPEVLCGSGVHAPLLVLAVSLIATFVAPFLALTFWANLTAAKNSASPSQANHIIRFRFLFYRFRPGSWWWGSVFYIRQILLAFSPMVQPDDPYAQIMFVVAVLFLYVAAACYFWPWKSTELNIVEVTHLVCLVFVVTANGALAPVSNDGFNYKVVILAFLVLIALVLGGTIMVASVMVGVKGMTEPFGRQFSASEHHRQSMSEQLHAICSQLAAMDCNSIAQILGLMASLDRAKLSDTIQMFWSMDIKGLGLDHTPSNRLSNITTAQRSRSLGASSSKLGGDAFDAPAAASTADMNVEDTPDLAKVEALLLPAIILQSGASEPKQEINELSKATLADSALAIEGLKNIQTEDFPQEFDLLPLDYHSTPALQVTTPRTPREGSTTPR